MSDKNSPWLGRLSSPTLGKQYWYQAIRVVDTTKKELIKNSSIALIGYGCDEGVRRNLGRVGAQHAPHAIREQLTKLPWHHENKRVADIGDFICENKKMEACQEAFSEAIGELINNEIFPIALGGGHDMAYGHFKGIQKALAKRGNAEQNRVGIINFDAHFDLRPVEKQPNSGTPFNQILSESKTNKQPVAYFAIGIQRQSNTKQLFEIAALEKVQYIMSEDCEAIAIAAIKEKLQAFIDRCDHLYLTIDMDGFSSAYAPGVSAPSPLGFSPPFVFKLLAYLMATGKVVSCDIAELNPIFDRDKQTAGLAARLVDYMVGLHLNP